MQPTGRFVLFFLLTMSQAALALPSSVTIHVNGDGKQILDLDKLVTRRISQSSEISSTCPVTCYQGSFDRRIPICNPGETYQVTCTQSIDTSYDVPDHTVSATVEISVENTSGFEINQDLLIVLDEKTVYVTGKNSEVGFLMKIESLPQLPRRGEPDFIHKVTLQPINIAKINESFAMKNLQYNGTTLSYETGVASDFKIKETLSIFRSAMFHNYDWTSFDRPDFTFKTEPFAGGLKHKLDLRTVGVHLRSGGKYDFTLYRTMELGDVKLVGAVDKFDNQSFSLKPEISF